MITMEYGVWAPDTVPPVVSIITNTTLTNQPNFVVDFLSDGKLKQTTFQLQEGENHLVIRDQDAAGNETEVPYPGPVILDTIKPLIQITSDLAVNSPNYTLSYTVDGELQTAAKYLIEGDNPFTIQESDLAGNITVQTVNVFLDSIPPRLEFQSSDITNQLEYLLRYTVDGVLKERLVTLREGVNSIEVLERDALNNETRVTFFVTLDTVPPVIEWLNPYAYVKDANYTLEYSVDGVRKSKIYSLREGLNEIGVIEQDAAHNINSQIFNVYLDTVPPQASVILNNGDEYATTDSVTLALTGEDANVDSMRFSLDGSTWTDWEPFETSKTLNVTQEGSHEIFYELRDKAGWVSQTSDLIVKDTVPPSGSIVINGNDAYTNTRDIILTLAAYDATSGIRAMRFQVAGSWTDWESFQATKAITLPDIQGEQTILFELKDKAGLVSQASDQIAFDSVEPEVIVTSKSLTNQENYLLEYTVDGIAKTSGFTLVEGRNVLEIVEEDPAGNQTRLTHEVTLDTVPPTGSILINAGDAYTTNQTATLTLTGLDVTSAVESVRFSGDQGANWTSWRPFESITSFGLGDVDGPQEIWYELRDQAGWVSRFTDTIILDRAPPTGSLLVNGGALYTNNLVLSLAISATDAASGVKEMRLMSQTQAWSDWEPFETSKTHTLSEIEGKHEVFVEVRDYAGLSERFSYSITYDSTPPSLVVRSASLVNTPDYELVYESDRLQKRRAVTLLEGENQLAISERDEAGNITEQNFTVTLDTIAPTITLNSSNIVNNPDYILSYTVDGILKTQASTLVEGENHLNVTESDAAGNVTFQNFLVTLDSIPPQIVVRSPGEVTESLYIFMYEVDGVPRSETRDLLEGENILTISESDAARNQTTLTFKVTLDSQAPFGTIEVNEGALYTTSPDLQITLNIQDQVSGLDKARFSLDGGMNWTDWETFTSSRALSILENYGEKDIRVEVRDKAGHIAGFSATINFVSDLTLEFLSAAQTTNENYLLEYRVNGTQEYQENWLLHPGINSLLITSELSGIQKNEQFEVTLNQVEPLEPLIPAIPILGEDLLSITTQNGWIAKYDGSSLVKMELAGLYEFYLPELDASGNLKGGLLVERDGSRTLIEDSHAIMKLSPNGEKTLYYANGLTRKIITSNGEPIRYAYQLDGQGGIKRILAMEESTKSLYEANGKPVWILKIDSAAVPGEDGTDIRYQEGILSSYKDKLGNLFGYRITNIQGGFESNLVSVIPSGQSQVLDIAPILADLANYPALGPVIENEILRKVTYDANKNITSVVSGKNELLNLAGGLPTHLVTASGISKSFSSSVDSLGNLNSITVSENGLSQTYEATGAIGAITLADGTTLNIAGETLDSITLTDGSIIKEIVKNGPTLTAFTRTYLDGRAEHYEASRLKWRKEPNGDLTTFLLIDGKDVPTTLETADGRVYHYLESKNSEGRVERTGTLISAETENGGRLEFDASGRPVRFIQERDVEIPADQIPDLPEGESYIPFISLTNSELRALTVDSLGNILSGEILFRDGTQYLIEDGAIKKQITPAGQIIEFSAAQITPPAPLAKIPAEPLTQEEETYRQALITAQLDYFLSGQGLDSLTGLPLDNLNSQTGEKPSYSQATLVGFWAEILASIATGDIVDARISKEDALDRLIDLLGNFRQVQTEAGYKGLVSFFDIEDRQEPVLDAQGNLTGQFQAVPHYRRKFNQVAIGDNLNLSVSLASVLGAMEEVEGGFLTAGFAKMAVGLYISQILTAQDEGYQEFYDKNDTKRFHAALNFNPSTGEKTGFTGQMDRMFNEFRTGLFWLAARNPEYKAALDNLDVAVKPYETESGEKIDIALPFDGGAFQMFWPLLHVDETQYPEFETAHRNFLVAQSEFIEKNNIPGLLSAGENPGAGYDGKIGLLAAAETADKLSQNVGSLYGTASAFGVAPHYALQLLKNIETKFPGIRNQFGFTDSLRLDPSASGTVSPAYGTHYYGVDQASFVLALSGKSKNYFQNYLNQQGLASEFDSLYRSQIFNLTPASGELSMPSDFSSLPVNDGTGQAMPHAPPVTLYSGASSNPDGRPAGLVKQESFVPSITDPLLGEGKIYNYFTSNSVIHHVEIEFDGATPKRVMRLEEYLAGPNQRQLARSLLANMKLDLLAEATLQGPFYDDRQLGRGFASSAIVRDPVIGEARRIQFDFKKPEFPVGIYAKYNNLDLSGFDYLSVPVRFGSQSEPVNLKVEFKGVGEILLTSQTSSDWQYFYIPIIRPLGTLNEIAVSIVTPDGRPAQGEVFLGPVSAFKIRTSNVIDYPTLLGQSQNQIKNQILNAIASQTPGVTRTERREEILENYELDEDGKLTRGTLRLADGGIQFYEAGRLVKWIFPNGKTALFEKGLASYIIDLSRGSLQEGRFYYDSSFTGNIRSFVLEDLDSRKAFDNQGHLKEMNLGGAFAIFDADGNISRIETEEAILTNLEFAEDGGILRGHVGLKDGSSEFEIDGTSGEESYLDPNGDRIFYNSERVTGIDPQGDEGRTSFTYTEDNVGGLTNARVILPTGENQSLAEYRINPLFTSQTFHGGEYIFDAPPVDYLKQAAEQNRIGSFSSSDFASGTRNFSGGRWYAELSYTFQSASGSALGLYVQSSQTVNISDQSFLAVTVQKMEPTDITQTFTLNVKAASYQTLYTFQIDASQTSVQTFMFPLEGKGGNSVEITLEPVRQANMVGRQGRIRVHDISYLSVRKLDQPIWVEKTGIDQKIIKQIYQEARVLKSVGEETALRRAKYFDELGKLRDIPAQVIYEEFENNGNKTLVLREFESLGGLRAEYGSNNQAEFNGVLENILLPDGTSVQTTNNASGLESIAVPSSTGSSQTNYQYGHARTITQPDGRQYEFRYEYESDGTEITVLKDVKTGEERHFREGRLVESRNSDGLLTTYQYTPDGELSGSDLSYRGESIQAVSYEFDGDQTRIKDERGTTWFYDKDGNLTKHLTRDGLLFGYGSFSQSLPDGVTLDPQDYKNAAYASAGLDSVTFLGYESLDSKYQWTYNKNGEAEVRIAGPEGFLTPKFYAVNVEFDGEQRIRSGQLQTEDGLIIEIENYLPVRGRLQDGSAFTVSFPAGTNEIKTAQDGTTQYEITQEDGNVFTYDPIGELIKVTTPQGETTSFLYNHNSSGQVASFVETHRKQHAINGIPFLAEMKSKADSSSQSIELLNGSSPLISHSGQGFAAAVYKEALGQWEVLAGTFSSGADRLALEQFLTRVEPGQSVAFSVNDASLGLASEVILTGIERIGGNQIREALAKSISGQNYGQSYSFFGQRGIQAANVLDKLGSRDGTGIELSTVTQTQNTVLNPSSLIYSNVSMALRIPETVSRQLGAFVQEAGAHKVAGNIQETTVYNEAGEIVMSQRIDGLMSFYEGGKIRETFNAEGELVYFNEYEYNAEGKPEYLKKITLVKTREDF
ncbi:MAG: RHS repeat protein [Candidatus Omnitrophica bacterium]|nr:RHS repeat protein [Candidatus Omnitrophota bacterium]